MNHHLLMTFVTVAQYLNFTEAARILNLSQPSVSHHIQSLEQFYKTTLFHRSHRQIRLTPAGEVLFKNAQELISLHEKVATKIKTVIDYRPIRVGCSNTIAEHYFPALITDFYSHHPELPANQLQATMGTSYEIVDKLQNEEIDIALVEGQENKYSFIKEIFTYDDVLLVAKPEIVTRPLEEMRWLVRENGCSIRNNAEKLWQRLNFRPTEQQVFEFPNNQMIKEAVKSGLGVALLSKRSIENELHAHELVTVASDHNRLHRPLFLLRKQESVEHQWNQMFWDHTLRRYDKVSLIS